MIAGPYFVACGLLAVAGAMKVWAPADTATALRAARLPASDRGVRVAGGAEALLALVAMASGSPAAAAAVSASYLVFAGFVAHALARRLPLSSCGCLGGSDTPPTPLHVGVNLGAAAAAGVAALDRPGSLGAVVAAQGWGGGAVLLALVAVTVALAGLTLSALPRARALRVRRST